MLAEGLKSIRNSYYFYPTQPFEGDTYLDIESDTDFRIKYITLTAGDVVQTIDVNKFVKRPFGKNVYNGWCHYLSLIHISEPTRPTATSRMPSSA